VVKSVDCIFDAEDLSYKIRDIQWVPTLRPRVAELESSFVTLGDSKLSVWSPMKKCWEVVLLHPVTCFAVDLFLTIFTGSKTGEVVTWSQDLPPVV
jgi:hypothetical protein